MKCTIVGKGRIGTMLFRMIPEAILVGREETIPSDYPIIVATRCDDLDDVLSRVPPHAHHQLIFVQNGMLFSWLEKNHLSNSTQVLLYVAVSAVGEEPVDGGQTVATGPLADVFCAIFQKSGLGCRVVLREEYNRELIEKYVWNCGFGLLCQYFSCSVGDVVTKHKKEGEALLWELAQDTADILQQSIDKGICERLCAYSLSIASYRGSLKEWPWRNGWLWDQHKGLLHGRYLKALGTVQD